MAVVIYRGSKSRADDTGSIQLTDKDGKDVLLRQDVEEDVSADVVKRLKSDEFSGHNFDFGKDS